MTLLGTIAGSFVLAPLYYRQATIQISIPEPIHLTLSYAVQQGRRRGRLLPCHDNLLAGDVVALWAVGLAVVGLLLFVVSLHLLNLLRQNPRLVHRVC